MDKLIIPEKLNVGFQKRSDTYTGKLSYIIYWDAKGVLRKQTSWESWRDKNIPNEVFLNEPTEGFVLNKKVGDHKTHFGHRSAHIRIYDPRNFEFEIGVDNLLYILSQCDCSKGKGLEGKFVYAWNGTDLVLLPVSSPEYRASAKFTDLQTMKVGKADMVAGCQYTFKDQTSGIYLGRLKVYDTKRVYSMQPNPSYGGHGYYGYNRDRMTEQYDHSELDIKMMHIFKMVTGGYKFKKGFTNIARKDSDTVCDDFAELIVGYESSIYGGKIAGYVLGESVDIKVVKNYNEYKLYSHKCDSDFCASVNADGDHLEIICGHWYGNTYKNDNGELCVYDGIIYTIKMVFNDKNELIEFSDRRLGSKAIPDVDTIKARELYALLENGSKVSLTKYLEDYRKVK